VKNYSCIVYLHGNCGNRLQGKRLVSKFLPKQIAVCCFDFAGAGNSNAPYISLGHYEY